MRRRSDEWVNATHILKIAGFDKPARTRILEREVQKGVHEKIQCGYGKYQGTWIPLTEGRMLAEKHGVLSRISAIFDFVPGDRSPPPAPKHTTAASNRPKQNKQPAAKKVASQPGQSALFTGFAQANCVQFNPISLLKPSRQPAHSTTARPKAENLLPRPHRSWQMTIFYLSHKIRRHRESANNVTLRSKW